MFWITQKGGRRATETSFTRILKVRKNTITGVSVQTVAPKLIRNRPTPGKTMKWSNKTPGQFYTFWTKSSAENL